MAGKSNKVWKIITDQFIERMEEGIIPWKKGWVGEQGLQRSINGNVYRGANQFLTQLLSMRYEHDSSIWATRKHIYKNGGKIKDGQHDKAALVVWWHFKKDDDGEVLYVWPTYYKVYNAAQFEGLDIPEEEKEEGREEVSLIDVAEKVIHDMPDLPKFEIRPGKCPAWSPIKDIEYNPGQENYLQDNLYYYDRFHELGHSCVHKSRLNIKLEKGSWITGSSSYAQEELTADMTAALLSMEIGMDMSDDIEYQAGYLQSWLKNLKDHPKMLMLAAQAAQKRVDYIVGREYEKAEKVIV